MPTLDEKVLALMKDDDHGAAACVTAWDGVHGVKGQHELDLIDWGVCFGIAVGIARGEDAWEPTPSVMERASKAARLAFDHYNGQAVRAVGEVA